MRGKCYQKEPTCLFPLRYYAVPKHYTVFEYPPKSRIFNLTILAFSTNFCPIKIDLSGNAVWPQGSGFQKLAQMAFLINFCPLTLQT